MGFKEVWRFFFPKKVKRVYPEGVIGCYDSRQFDSLQYDLDYAGEKLVYNEDSIDGNNLIKIFTRNYKDTTFVNGVEIVPKVDENPNTGVYNYVLEFTIVAAISAIVYLVFKSKKKFKNM